MPEGHLRSRTVDLPGERSVIRVTPAPKDPLSNMLSMFCREYVQNRRF